VSAQAAWDWMVAAYARPGAREASLELQDRHGQCVSFLLWAAWTGETAPAPLQLAARFARRWEAEVVAPLRGVRRALKPARPPTLDVVRQDLRAQVQAVELGAERMLVEALQRMVPAAAEPASRLAALKSAASAWGGPAPESALAALAACIE